MRSAILACALFFMSSTFSPHSMKTDCANRILIKTPYQFHRFGSFFFEDFHRIYDIDYCGHKIKTNQANRLICCWQAEYLRCAHHANKDEREKNAQKPTQKHRNEFMRTDFRIKHMD